MRRRILNFSVYSVRNRTTGIHACSAVGVAVIARLPWVPEGPPCRGGRHRCTRQAVRDGLFSAPIDVAYRPEGQPSRPCLCPSPNPPPAFGSAPARKLLSYPIPTRAVSNFRGLADRSLLTRTPTRTRRGPSQPR